MKEEAKIKVLKDQVQVLENVAKTLEQTFDVEDEFVDAYSFLNIVIEDLKGKLDTCDL